ncbi:folylpolyglutamate synthase [Coemansia thaxteri]|nr:folylpolyglutamate synthase [Coemansia thaxteri]KAJ2471559.1 folylpolyglutamate synthase [Coemansia sp. RSA 2322]
MVDILSQLVLPGDSLWLVPFSQPSEMPWIKCESTDAIFSAAHKIPSFGKIHITQFASLADALDQLTTDCSDAHLNVLCGSLYLVADLFRELQVQPFDAPLEAVALSEGKAPAPN